MECADQASVFIKGIKANIKLSNIEILRQLLLDLIQDSMIL